MCTVALRGDVGRHYSAPLLFRASPRRGNGGRRTQGCAQETKAESPGEEGQAAGGAVT